MSGVLRDKGQGALWQRHTGSGHVKTEAKSGVFSQIGFIASLAPSGVANWLLAAKSSRWQIRFPVHSVCGAFPKVLEAPIVGCCTPLGLVSGAH